MAYHRGSAAQVSLLALIMALPAGRALVLGDSDEATLHYQSAATQPVAYYGQLAAERMGVQRLALRAPEHVATGA